MKKSILLPLLFIVIALVFGVGGFWVGHYREHRIANSLIAGSFMNNFEALEKLRAGDTESTTRSLERHAFLHATFLLDDSAPQQQQVIGMFRSRLVAYRRTYRANSAEWTPMERKLEELLRKSKLKSPNHALQTAPGVTAHAPAGCAHPAPGTIWDDRNG